MPQADESAGAVGAGINIGGNANGANIIQGSNNTIGPSLEELRTAVGSEVDAADARRRARQELEDTQRRGQTLQDYLVAVRGAAPLSYTTLRQNWPSLWSVYVAQTVVEEPPAEAPAAWETARPESLLDALGRHGHLLVEAGPGLGKSSLVYRLASTLADRFRSDSHGPGLVPVCVSARGLAEHAPSGLSEALRRQTNTELGLTQAAELPTGFFSEPPAPGATWLVLIDGLDEVSAQIDRTRLVEALASHVKQPVSLYRFVVTSRPISELAGLEAAGWGRYTVPPFAPDQVETFARTWFAARPNSSAGNADGFLRRIDESSLGELAHTPLLLKMAAVVYEREQSAPLPVNRAGLYRKFVQILLAQDPGSGTPDVDRLAALVMHLALWSYAMPGAPLVPEAARYEQVKKEPSKWQYDGDLEAQMATILTRTGLVSNGAFLHETLREYLAAAALAERHKVTDPASWTVVRGWRTPAGASESAQSPLTIGFEGWREVVLFVLAIWSEDHQDTTEVLRRIWPADATRGLLDRFRHRNPATNDRAAVLFVGTAVAEGARASSTFTDEVIGELIEATREMRDRELREVPNPLGVLASFRRNRRVRDALLEIASAPEMGQLMRVRAAEAVGRLGYVADAAQRLLGLLRTSQLAAWVRADAAAALTRLGCVDQLLEVARDADADDVVRGEAADGLARLGRTPELASLAQDVTVATWPRVRAAIALGVQGRAEEALVVLSRVAADHAVPSAVRIEAAAALGQLGAVDAAASVLLDLARDTTIGVPERGDAAAALERIGRLDGALVLSLDAALDDWVRTRAAEAVGRLGNLSEAYAVLSVLAQDPHSSQATRVDAAAALGRLGRVSGALALLMPLARDPGVAGWIRAVAVKSLLQLGHASGLVELALESTLDTRTRAVAAEAAGMLGRLADAQSVLLELAQHAVTPDAEREEAAEALDRLGQTADAANILTRLVREGDGIRPEVRLQAVSALARYGRISEARAAAQQLLSGTAVDAQVRTEAAALIRRLTFPPDAR